MAPIWSVTLAAVGYELGEAVVKSVVTKLESGVEAVSVILNFSGSVRELEERFHSRARLFLNQADTAAHTEVEGVNERVKIWVRNVYEIAISIQDVVHACKGYLPLNCSSSLPEEFSGNWECCCVVWKSQASEFNPCLSTRLHFQPKVQATKARLIELEQSAVDLGLAAYVSSSPYPDPQNLWKSSRFTLNTDTFEDADRLAGEIESLVDRNRVVAVVGMVGCGKTRLLRRVFKRIKSKFQVCIWLPDFSSSTVSQIQVHVHEQVFGYRLSSTSLEDRQVTLNHALDRQVTLNHALSIRDSMVVLDLKEQDTVDPEALWEKMRAVGLPENGRCKILISTENHDVATKLQARIFEMPFLSEEIREQLFLKHLLPHCILGWINLDDYQRAVIRRRVLRPSSGLPLTIIIAAGVLRQLHPTEWSITLQNMAAASDAKHALFEALRLGFSSLEDGVKPCFKSLVAFAAEEEIDSDKLIGIWKAEGLVERDVDGFSMMMHLANRCLIHPVHREWEISSRYVVTVHEKVRALAVTAVKGRGGAEDLPQPHHELRVSRISPITHISEIPSTCSVLLFNNDKQLQEFSRSDLQCWANARALRILNPSCESMLLDRVKSLRFLRFLDISRVGYATLSPCVRSLECLEHLYTSIEVVPEWIHELRSLIHFSTSPKCIWNIRSSGTMPALKVIEGARIEIMNRDPCEARDVWTWKGLSQFPQLQEATLEIRASQSSDYNLPRSVISLSLLRSRNESPLNLRSLFKNLHKLKYLRLKNINLPEQFRAFNHLVTLHLMDVEQYPEEMCKLSALRRLWLDSNNFYEELPEDFGKAGAFPQLESLRLTLLLKLKVLPMLEDGAMPELKALTIEDCPRLRGPAETEGWTHREVSVRFEFERQLLPR